VAQIMNFRSTREFSEYLKKNCILQRVVGVASEGICYPDKLHQYAYKVFHMGEAPDREFADKIITTEDIQLDSFAFPITLFTSPDSFLGYTSNLVHKDLFSSEMTYYLENIREFPFDKLLKAYDKMISDVEKLSKEQIRIFDLPFNLLFDGERLTAIDTCYYTREERDVLQENLDSLHDAIFSVFELWTDSYGERENYKNMSIEEYLKMIQSVYVPKKRKIYIPK